MSKPKPTAKVLNQKLNTLIARDEPSSVQKDCKQALKSKSILDKQVAITEYNKWIRS